MAIVKEIIRLDKFLCDMGIGTRSEVKSYLKKGRVTVNGEIVKSPDFKIKVTKDEIQFDNKYLKYQRFEYYMLNKPAGVVSATIDNVNTTVIELITTSDKKDLFPVGRLDKDTEGLLIITNDGDLAHQLLSPKKHVGKTYFAKINGFVTESDIEIFRNGIDIEEDFTTLPADLRILTNSEVSKIEVTIYEGKFHQVKRMFQKLEKEVIYLKRLSMGTLTLDSTLAIGEYRSLTEEEIKLLKSMGSNG